MGDTAHGWLKSCARAPMRTESSSILLNLPRRPHFDKNKCVDSATSAPCTEQW